MSSFYFILINIFLDIYNRICYNKYIKQIKELILW
nr:MAG TPA: hypothetical protein [Ackermannviridae sp.]